VIPGNVSLKGALCIYCIYCYACKLLSSQSNLFINGFCDWKHPERISNHKKSVDHRQHMLALLNSSKTHIFCECFTLPAHKSGTELLEGDLEACRSCCQVFLDSKGMMKNWDHHTMGIILLCLT